MAALPGLQKSGGLAPGSLGVTFTQPDPAAAVQDRDGGGEELRSTQLGAALLPPRYPPSFTQ